MFRFLWVSLGVLCLGGAARAEILPPGHRPPPAGVHALTGAKVITKPGEVIENGVIVLRDGLIEAVGKELAPPADARVWELPGRVIYAGFIDPHLASGSVPAPAPAANDAAAHTDTLTAGGGFDFFGVAGQERDPGGAGPSSPLATITPERRVAAAYTPDAKLVETMRELGFTAANIAPGKGVLRGSGALVLLADANPNRLILQSDVFQHIAFTPSGGDAFPNSLMGVIAAVRQSFFDAGHYRDDHTHYRAHPTGRSRPPFNPALAALAPALAKTQRVEFEPGGVVMVDRAARVARELGLDFCILASGQEWRRPDLAKAAGAPFIVPLSYPELPKLPEETDWQAVSLDQLRAWDWAPENAALLRQQGLEIALTTHGLDDRKNFRRNLRLAVDRGLSEADALAALTTVPARLCGVEQQLGTIEAGKIANLTVVQGSSYFDPEAKVREVWVDGRVYLPKPDALAATNTPAATNKTAKASAAAEARKKLTARSPLAGRGSFTNPPAVLVRGATIWTSGNAGRLTNADLLVVDGRVKAIGAGIGARDPDAARALVIDGQGKHVTPGIIDAHSHSMIVGSVNEGTLPSTAMVRVADVVNSETANIHQQLAGGVTVANQLHGSANPIGGQNAVIKLRDGATPEELKFTGAPEGIKFALGENVKQSNWGENKTTRFPQTRMGVPTFMANRFLAARQYLQALAAFKQSGGAPPRRDLELEALGEIITGQRLIHCHSYRQDEIVAFLRVMEEFGVKVATLQHVLEGYKVADEIAQHGAGGSTFADWWGYKFEVYDAIAHNASLMRDRGVVVSINSDSDDHARRIYLEAAKAVKFGGAPEEEALKMVTLNPAKQLRIDQRVGSLEPGKDGDFVLWSASPLSTTTICLQTWIDGKKYFDRDLNAVRVTALAQERKELLEKARMDGGKGEGKGSEAARAAFFRRALEQARDHQTAQCLDCDGGRETP